MEPKSRLMKSGECIMPERKYSISEIDEMRSYVRLTMNRYGFTPYKTEEVESRLRTYMMNGTSVEELREAADKAVKDSEEAQAAARKRLTEREAIVKRRKLENSKATFEAAQKDLVQKMDALKSSGGFRGLLKRLGVLP